MSKSKKRLSDVTVQIIETSAHDTAVAAPVVAAPKMTPQTITIDAVRAAMAPYASIMFTNVRNDYDAKKNCDRTHRATIVDVVDDRILCVAAKTIYTFSLAELRNQLLTMPIPKSTCQQFDAGKFANDCKNNVDREIFVPYAKKSKFFADYVPA